MRKIIMGLLFFTGCIKGHESYDTAGGNLPTNYVIIQPAAFSPSALTVSAGSTITFVNNDNAVHSIQTDDSTTIRGLSISAGASYIFKKDTSGVFNYHCGLHPSVKGTFILTP